MAIVDKFGKSNLFITMTYNPKWHEIEKNLLHASGINQQASDLIFVFVFFNVKKGYLID